MAYEDYVEEAAEVYDAVHQGRGKDYRTEAADIAKLVRTYRTDAASLLDVACGTGSHLRFFAEEFAEVEGVELSEDMVGIARRKTPSVRLHQGDMRDFALGREFDAVTCMFSSIGHMADTAELDSAVATFAHHLTPGGVVVVEPWWFPETFTPGYIAADVVRADGRTISRVSHSIRENDHTRIEVHYVVATAERGIRHFSEVHEITLFERPEYERAFVRAGLRVEFLEGGPSGRGLFVGVRD
ncbi:class I SAM-dependent methyltransferase [Allokutzneria sp. A3M-2-11 16]|uniref:class I SAM-dependent DNA methyltransferase n=1 Tax=Allokutzneria sp. A3M-2-11 16 TaxID=2962043 RepID=UPI0020B7A9FC|nr:class I SAM-dependent methyltransferase [Allokutzneria sp. A3M-2-11 16]MCP3804653.1 class I SAM-dependent methyltransferase [Allokutzneria sp. A3M-2-11 16]